MNFMPDKIMVIPCSGMGKVYGLISRESALKTVEDCPDEAATMCLAYIVTGDEEAGRKIRGKKCITLDGCPAMCAAKSVGLAGGVIEEKRRVIDTFRKHKGAKPGTPTELNGEGWLIADEIAGEICETVKELAKENGNGR
jgi:uncharacterized metal-binding protein